MNEIRLGFSDHMFRTPLEVVRSEYTKLPVLDVNSIRNFQGIGPLDTVLEAALLDVMKNPGWLKGPDTYQRDTVFLDKGDIEWLTENPTIDKARKILENTSRSAPMGEQQVESVIMRSFELLVQKHPQLALFRCHIFDTKDGVQGIDYSFGSQLSTDISNYALPTAFPVLAVLPMGSLVQLYRSREIQEIASEGNWVRDSIEIHSKRNNLHLYRIDKRKLNDINKIIDSSAWKIQKF